MSLAYRRFLGSGWSLAGGLAQRAARARAQGAAAAPRERVTRPLAGVRGLAGGKVKMVWSYQGEKVEVEAEEGQTLLEVAHANDIELEGACGGELACSTCHIFFDKSVYDALPAKKEEEEDMLDLAWGLTDTSRLGCQIKVGPVLEGALITIPEETNNMMTDDAGSSSSKKN